MQPIEAAQAAMVKQGMQNKQPPTKEIASSEEAIRAAELAKPAEIELTPVEPRAEAAEKAAAEKSVVTTQAAENVELDAPSKQATANGHSKESEIPSANSEKTTPEREGGTSQKAASCVQEQTLQNGNVRNVASKQSKPTNGTTPPLAGGAAVLARLR